MPKACKVPTSGSDDGKYSFAKTSARDLHVEQKIVGFDDRSDGACDHCAAQLHAVLRVGQTCGGRYCHPVTSLCRALLADEADRALFRKSDAISCSRGQTRSPNHRAGNLHFYFPAARVTSW